MQKLGKFDQVFINDPMSKISDESEVLPCQKIVMGAKMTEDLRGCA